MADYKVLWTETALEDLEDIYDFIAKDSKEAAQRIIEQILNRESQLLSQPESGSIQN